MTREEAIAFFKDMNECTYGNLEAVEMAIKALEQEPTTKNDLGVDWDELKRKILMEVDGGTDDKWLSYADVCDNISNSIDDFKADLPSVTPLPKTGHWIMTSDYLTTAYGSIDYVKCSCCGEDSLEEGNFCPNCGAKMVEPQESEEE